jgi:hypothetical protein
MSETRIPAIPPEDYKGSQADWMVKLQERGLWNGEGWHGDIYISTDDWWEILEECEANDRRT